MSSVNVAEVVAKCIEKAFPEQLPWNTFKAAISAIVDFDLGPRGSGGRTARRRASKGMLSLGDRACIATAIQEDAMARDR